MANPIATYETSEGTFKAELFVDQMPITASNHVALIKSGFYDGLHFHRLIPNFMIQFGCLHSKQFGSPRSGTGDSPLGKIKDEHTAKLTNAIGTLSMANSGPNSGAAQFFINTNPSGNAFLDWFDASTRSAHPVFGKVTEGWDVVKKIEALGTSGGTPKKAVQMIKVTVDGE